MRCREINATAHQAVLLADHSVTRQGVGILVDGQLCRAEREGRAAIMANSTAVGAVITHACHRVTKFLLHQMMLQLRPCRQQHAAALRAWLRGPPLGQPLPIFSTARHLANRAPCS